MIGAQLALTCALVLVDAAALGVGLTVLRRVTRIVKETASAVQEATDASIAQAQADAVTAFMAAAAPVFAGLPSLLHKGFEELLRRARITPEGHVELSPTPLRGDDTPPG